MAKRRLRARIQKGDSGQRQSDLSKQYIAKWGAETFMLDHKADVTEGPRGTLWSVTLSYFDVKFMEVVDTVCDEHGEPKHHWLRVPPWVVNPHEAVSWTFGFHSHGYNPGQES